MLALMLLSALSYSIFLLIVAMLADAKETSALSSS